MVDPIADMKAAEDAVLSHANEIGKFAVACDARLDSWAAKALERLQISGRVRLIDVAYPAVAPGRLHRIFLVVAKDE